MKRKTVLCLTAAVLLACLFLAAVPGAKRQLRESSRAAIRDAVVRSAVQCYAVEGVYPPSLAYLEERYGLRVNHDAYIVSYEAFASNQLPDIRVLVRGEG